LFRRNVGTGQLANIPELYFISKRKRIAALAQQQAELSAITML